MNETPAVTANAATSHGFSSRVLEKTSASAIAVSTTPTSAAMPKRKALTGGTR